MLLMQRDSKNSRLGPQSVAGSYVSNRSEGQKSLASLAGMMSEKVTLPLVLVSRSTVATTSLLLQSMLITISYQVSVFNKATLFCTGCLR